MILHHEGIVLQKGYEALEAISIKEQSSNRVIFYSLAGDFEVSCYAESILRMRWKAEQSSTGLWHPGCNLRKYRIEYLHYY